MATKPVQMACVSIAYDTYLMPADKAMKLVELMQSAVACVRDYTGGGGYTYTATMQPDIELKLVNTASIRMPAGSSMSAPVVGPKRLPSGVLKQLK